MGAQVWDGNAADWKKGKELYFEECKGIAFDSIDSRKNDYLMTGWSYEDGAVEEYIRDQVVDSPWTDLGLAEWTFSFTHHLADAVMPASRFAQKAEEEEFFDSDRVHATAQNAMEADAEDFVDEAIEAMKG